MGRKFRETEAPKELSSCDPREDKFKKEQVRTSLVVQWLRLCASNAGGTGLIPGQGSTTG